MTTPNPVDIGKLVERLRGDTKPGVAEIGARAVMECDLQEAASALTALVKERDAFAAGQERYRAAWEACEAERDRLRVALRPFAEFPISDIWTDTSLALVSGKATLLAGDFRRARQALGAEQ